MGTLCLLAQPNEGQQQFKNKKQPELTENQTVWKSDNQGDKEETFIQTGRRDGDGQQGGEDSQQGGKVVAGGPSKVADCGAGWAKLQCLVRRQLVDQATDRTTQGSRARK